MRELIERVSDFPKLIVEGDLEVNSLEREHFLRLKSIQNLNESKANFFEKSACSKLKDVSEFLESSALPKKTLKERIQEVQVLSSEEKKAFEEWFVRFKFKKGMAVYNLFKISKRLYSKGLQEEVYKELVSVGVLEERTYLICPTCRDKELAASISEIELANIKQHLNGNFNELTQDFLDSLECESCGCENLTISNLVERKVYTYNL